MRPDRILHPELAAALATLGHTDIILVTDAGFPIPPQAKRIDLGFWPGTVDVLHILRVLRKEIFVEEVRFASEVRDCHPQLYRDVQTLYTGSGAEFQAASHETLCHDLARKPKLLSVPDHLIRGPISRWLPVPILLPGSPMNLA